MPSEPAEPRLYKHQSGKQRWLTTWYQEGRHSKSFGFLEDGVDRREAVSRFNHFYSKWKMRADIRAGNQGEDVFTIVQLAARYLARARVTYVKYGKVTTHLSNVRPALRELRDAHGEERADGFGAPELARLRDAMIWTINRQGQRVARSRKTVNGRMTIIIDAFKYAREKNWIPRGIVEDLQMVKHLNARSEAKASVPVKPVHESLVEVTTPFMSGVVRDMVRLLAIMGCRPQEICSMRGCEIEMPEGKDLWLYRPRHKLEHMEGEEVVRFLGPRAQEIIRKYLRTDLQAYLFSPAEAYGQKLAEKRAGRKTPLYPSHAARHVENPTHKQGDRYTTNNLRRAIHYACRRAKVGAWNPNQLRHSVGTELRGKYGLEGASVGLGHKHMSTTEIYAEQSAQLAMLIAREVG